MESVIFNSECTRNRQTVNRTGLFGEGGG